ncbi:GyrI-like domain-containing protein [Streptomyces collinus]|uniref:GyrI-like domain-containing protein n=1 Tax=Streptomyces collinus TaxID=42684 RepID=UPI00367EA23F
MEVGFVTDRAVRPQAGVVAGSLPAGRVARLTHFGSFDALGSSWQRLHSWMRERQLTAGPCRGRPTPRSPPPTWTHAICGPNSAGPWRTDKPAAKFERTRTLAARRVDGSGRPADATGEAPDPGRRRASAADIGWRTDPVPV